MAEYQFGHVTPQIAQTVWPKVEPFIAKALKRGGLSDAYLPIDVLCQIQRREAGLWIACLGEEIHGAVITKIIDHPRCRVLNGFLVGGKNMAGWWNVGWSALDKYARQMGCVAIEGGARRGWVKHGFEITGVSLVRKL